MESLEQKEWLPIEATPTVFSKYAQRLGFPIVDLAFYDVVSLEPDMWLAMVPSPVAAVIVAFPMKELHMEMRMQQYEEQKSETEAADINPCR